MTGLARNLPMPPHTEQVVQEATGASIDGACLAPAKTARLIEDIAARGVAMQVYNAKS